MNPAGTDRPTTHSLGQGRVRVLSLPLCPDHPVHHDVLADCTPEEVRRAARFVDPRDAAAHLVARALVRRALRDAFPGLGLADVPWTTGPWGKPALVPRDGPVPDVRFNLSHCRTRVCCALAVGVECGIDIEPVGREVSAALLRYACTPREQAEVSRRGEVQRGDRFVRLWTAKESVLKALGTGLRIPPDAVDVEIGVSGPRLRGLTGHATPDCVLRQRVHPDGHVESVAVLTDREIDVEWRDVEWRDVGRCDVGRCGIGRVCG